VAPATVLAPILRVSGDETRSVAVERLHPNMPSKKKKKIRTLLLTGRASGHD